MSIEPTHCMLDLIELSEELGLEPSDSYTSKYFLKHKEYALAFETLVMRIYEVGMPVSDPLFEQIQHTAQLLNIPLEAYKILRLKAI